MTNSELYALLRGIAGPLQERFSALEARLAELEARPALQDKGVWSHGSVYDAGDIATHHGSA